MDQLLQVLKSIPEYSALLTGISQGQSSAISGIGQINRSHLIAGLYSHCDRPLVVICQDDMAARRLQEELKAFLAEEFPILPSRELTLYDTAVVSRAWEQKRMRQLYQLSHGQTRLQILSWEALSQRTIPPATLHTSAFTLKIGGCYELNALLEALTEAGYTRCPMVEGPGQFAVHLFLQLTPLNWILLFLNPTFVKSLCLKNQHSSARKIAHVFRHYLL